MHLPGCLVSTQKGAKAFLREMRVIGKDIGDSLVPHGLHRDAIREAIAFVEPRLVKVEPAAKGTRCLRDNPNVLIAHHACISAAR